MTNEIQLLAVTAAGIGFFHTLAGPDHYLPFIMMARARKWSAGKTAWITLACGLGHVLSSVVLGVLGVAFGIALHKLEFVESFRGNIAAWGLTAFGFAYMVWGIWQAIKNKPHTHKHIHEDGSLHEHEHGHIEKHAHVHDKKNITPWILFTLFIFGPCEPLIPILMYPAAKESLTWLIFVTLIFSVVTICTMLTIVLSALFGFNFLPFRRFEKYSHAIAGGALLACGCSILFLRL